jgi:5-methyltetrahydropteroyltriglutamate--homocysteine methyltransferase
MMGDPEARAALHAAGEDPERLTDAYVRAIAEAVRDRPASMTVALHLCRGNYRGRWLAAGGYDPVAARVLTIPSVDLFLLEYDSPRAGDFGPLAALPRDKRVMLGLVTTKSAALESPDALRRRIDEAARVVGLDRLGLCPQCGFGTNLTGSPMSVADEEAKLRLVVEVAREVWG